MDNQKLQANIDALTASFGNADGDWQLLYSQDNLIYASPTRIVKLSRKHDAPRLANGLAVAIASKGYGVGAVQPLIDEVVYTSVAPATLWPRVQHRHVTASSLSPEDGFCFGQALAKVSTMRYGEPFAWDPFMRVEHRLAISNFPSSVLAESKALVEKVSGRIEPELFNPTSFVYAHGDAHVGNVLFNESANLIDFDSSGWCPVGWDIACLYNHLVLEAQNFEAFDAIGRAWHSVFGTVPVGTAKLSLVKATMGTTFALTLEPKQERIEAVKNRLAVLNDWADTLEPPKTLPKFNYFD